jgi:hypothetical protein
MLVLSPRAGEHELGADTVVRIEPCIACVVSEECDKRRADDRFSA